MKKNNHNSFLSFSLAKGFSSPNIPIATFYQGEKELNFIIDTGSDDNVIDKDALYEIEHGQTQPRGTLTGLGGIYEVEACDITFQHEKDSFTELFIVSNPLKDAFDHMRKCYGIQLHGMLGSKFLKNNNLVLDFNELTAYNKA